MRYFSHVSPPKNRNQFSGIRLSPAYPCPKPAVTLWRYAACLFVHALQYFRGHHASNLATLRQCVPIQHIYSVARCIQRAFNSNYEIIYHTGVNSYLTICEMFSHYHFQQHIVRLFQLHWVDARKREAKSLVFKSNVCGHSRVVINILPPVSRTALNR